MAPAPARLQTFGWLDNTSFVSTVRSKRHLYGDCLSNQQMGRSKNGGWWVAECQITKTVMSVPNCSKRYYAVCLELTSVHVADDFLVICAFLSTRRVHGFCLYFKSVSVHAHMKQPHVLVQWIFFVFPILRHFDCANMKLRWYIDTCNGVVDIFSEGAYIHVSTRRELTHGMVCNLCRGIAGGRRRDVYGVYIRRPCANHGYGIFATRLVLAIAR